MKKIELTKEEKSAATAKIQRYFEAELDQPIGTLAAEFLLEFFATEIGPYFYNQGLRDAHAAFLKKMDDVAEDIYLLERVEPEKK